MWTIAVLSALFISVSCNKTQNYCVYPEKIENQADYYWREYLGIIPKDAVPGGLTRDGAVSYIAQIPTSKVQRLIVGNIYPGKKEAVACPVTRIVDGQYVKILCSNPQNKLEWITTTADNSHLLTDYHWVIGGVEGEVTFIGRATFEGEVQIGRVFDSKSPYKGLWICNKAGDQTNFQSFDLLVLPR